MSDRYDNLIRMYDRDMARWRQGHGPMPVLSDYTGKPKSESCLLSILKLVGFLILGVIGCALLWIFGFYFLFRMIFG